MAVASRQVSVATSPVLLADLSSTSGGANVVLFNSDATNTCFIGGVDVTTSNGIALKPGTTLSLTLSNPDAFYAVCPSTITVHVLRSGSA